VAAVQAATLPSASVGGVTATSPVVRATTEIAVAATVTPTFDASSGPTTVQTSCTACNNNNLFCATSNNTVKSKQVLTTTTIAVSNTMTTVRVAPEFGARNPTIAGMTRDSDGQYRGTLPTQTIAADGIHTVTVTAYVSEDVATTTSTTTKYMGGSSCSGTLIQSASSIPVTLLTQKYGNVSSTGSYVLDINPPTIALPSVQAQHSVPQGGNKFVRNIFVGGSASTPYGVTDTLAGPNGYVVSGPGADTFGPSGKGTGIAPDKHDTVAVHLTCDAPLGEYSVAGVANTVDLAGNAFDPVAAAGADRFSVIQGQFLQDQTFVVSELPSSGDFAPMTCFSATTANKKVTALPGSLYLTATVNSTGNCSGFFTIATPRVSLTLPAGFSFANTTGPKAQVFVGPAGSGFDLHYPQSLADVTGLIPATAIVSSGQTVTVDLSQMNLPQLNPSAGVIPSANTIYIRARAIFSGTSVPAPGTQYSFRTSATASLPGIGVTTSDSYEIVTASSACVNGN